MVLNIKKQIDYLLKLTDKNGLVEHCYLDRPDYPEGYCVDDNARALQVCLRLKFQYPILKSVLPVYFSFLQSAANKNNLRNDLNSDFTWRNDFLPGGEHYGRCLAALGETIKSEPHLKLPAIRLFNQIYSPFTQKASSYPRVSAQIILGLRYYHPADIGLWADSLVSLYLKEKTDSWLWFEPLLSYDNGRLPLALLTAHQITNKNQYLQVALESLDFLTSVTFNQKLNCFVFPGNRGWFTASGSRNIFDQQPLEAGSATEAYSLAFQITRNKKYLDLAEKSFAWYHGQNIIKANMVNSQGGTYDGFDSQKVNQNQGAESVLSYLLAYSAIKTTKIS